MTSQYAAMPSFHFGWNLLCGVCLGTAFRRRALRLLTFGLPFIIMGLAILVTGNHYIVDGVVGALWPFLAWRYTTCTDGCLSDARTVSGPPEAGSLPHKPLSCCSKASLAMAELQFTSLPKRSWKGARRTRYQHLAVRTV